MWESLVRVPQGSNSLRKFSRVLATFFVACFGYLLATTPTAYAVDATWNGDAVVHQDRTYERIESNDDLPNQVKSSPAIYQYVDSAVNPNLVYFIYFANGVTEPKDEKEATYVRYTLNPPNRYINKTGETKIELEPGTAQAPESGDGVLGGQCTISGIGYFVCPLMNGVAEGMDFVYNRIRGFLEVQPMSTSVDNPIYRIWVVMRDLANIAFVIGFMVIIYSYIAGGGFNGYEIRKILPRIVVAAVLINISYVVCALAVDISNISGYSINQIFENVRDTTLSGSDPGVSNVNWTSVTSWILAGGVGGAAAVALLPGATGATGVAAMAGGLWMLLAPFLLGAALLVMVTFFILAARQAIIFALIAIAPLAFAAYILPNTEKWFEKWRSLFFTMLIMFPAFGAVFGAAQLAGEAIIRMARQTGSIEQIILGLGVMVAPLAITPLLLKLGGGVLNRFGGVINNPRKGLYDRYKNYNKERLDERRANAAGINAEMLAAGSFKRRQFARRRAAVNYAKNNYRSEKKKQDEERAMNAWHTQTGRWGYDNHDKRDGDPLDDRDPNRNRLTRHRQSGYGNLATYKKDNELKHNLVNAEHEEHWQHTLQHDATRRGMLTDTRLAENRGKVISGAMEAQDERTFQANLNEANTQVYADLKAMKINTSVDAGVAEVQKAAIESAGKVALSSTIEADQALVALKTQTYANEKRAERYDAIVQKAAEASWNTNARTDNATQELYIRAQQAEDNAGLAEQQLKTFVQEVRTKGGEAPGVAITAQQYADAIKEMTLETDVSKNAEAAAQKTERIEIQKQYSDDEALRMRAGGIGGRAAANLVKAKAFQAIVNDQVEGTKAEKSLLGQTTSDEIFAMMDDPDASVEQLAAYAGTIASRGYHADHIKLLHKASGMYQDAVDSGDQGRVGMMKDMIQQIGADQSKIAFGLRDLDRTLLSEGRYDANIYKTSRDRILSNLSPEVLANMDPDDINMLYEMHVKGLLTPEQSKKIRDEWDNWQNDDILKVKIQNKHRNYFDRIVSGDYTTPMDGLPLPDGDKYGLDANSFN